MRRSLKAANYLSVFPENHHGQAKMFVKSAQNNQIKKNYINICVCLALKSTFYGI